MEQKSEICAICREREANKSNSHLIPDFLVKKVASVDDKPDRDKELLYEIYGGVVTNTMVTRDVSPDLLENLFGNSLDEVVKNGSNTIVAKDYIFCNKCEKLLSDLLESPYATTLGRNIEMKAHIPYFFWLSVIWRISKFNIFKLEMQKHIIESLGKCLNAYIKTRESKGDIAHIISNLPFDYSVIYCKDFSLSGNGVILAEYDRRDKTFLLILGDFVLYAYFSKHKRLQLAKKYNLEDIFANTQTYKELGQEQVSKVNSEVFKHIYRRVIQLYQEEYIQGRENLIRFLWLALRKDGMDLPTIPSEEFFRFVKKELYFGEGKSGERGRLEFIVRTFCKGLKQIYGIEIPEKL